jgi:hypothetical protein
MATTSVQSASSPRFVLHTSSITLLSLGALLLAAPAQALDFTTWTRVGDVSVNGTQGGVLTNAFAGDDGAVNFNLSGSNPVDINQVESFLGLPIGSLGDNSLEGSAIKRSLTVQAGDEFTFGYNFLTNEPETNGNLDFAFVSIGSEIEDLVSVLDATLPSNPFLRETGVSTYSYVFPTAGTFTIGIGVIDDSDVITSSALQIGNAPVNPIPTPALLPGLIGFGISVLRRRQAN